MHRHRRRGISRFYETTRLTQARRHGPGAGRRGAAAVAGADSYADALRQHSPGRADYTLRIAPVTVELDRSHIISTIGYNGTAPGPVLRMREGKPVTVDVINDTDTPEFVHWHGMLIPAEVDGTEEEGSPLVPPHGRRRFQLTPGPAGSRWYHSHAMAMDDLHKGSYTGQFGFVYVDGGNDPATTTRSSFSPCAIGSRSSPTRWKTMTTIPTAARFRKNRPC